MGVLSFFLFIFVYEFVGGFYFEKKGVNAIIFSKERYKQTYYISV